MTKRIFSGVQPTGNLHLGNYLGAIRNWVQMQHDYEAIFCIVDLHAITVPQDPEALRAATREVTAAYIACGIDPEKNTIFNQSMVSVHAELGWILGCYTPLGWLNRMTQFKEKMQLRKADAEDQLKKIRHELKQYKKGKGRLEELLHFVEIFVEAGIEDSEKTTQAKLGLYSYPVLMAADILGYKATHVPVGEDQKQHLELARDIAGAFNRRYGVELFPQPEPVIQGAATRVMSLRDGTKKMSKSDESDYSRINLTDDADTIAAKIRKAKSDMEPGLSFDVEKRPEAANLINIYSALSGDKRDDIVSRFATSGFSEFKKSLADVAVAHLEPITGEMRRLQADKGYIDAVLKRGAERANDVAQGVLKEVKDVVGFLRV
ncbi:MAG: tryptophan--tRNA ligase [Alphaproteobacteria bacterium]|nr:tryptophan--tRNA ligase [Alphaproteobacteria bacterium]